MHHFTDAVAATTVAKRQTFPNIIAPSVSNIASSGREVRLHRLPQPTNGGFMDALVWAANPSS